MQIASDGRCFCSIHLWQHTLCQFFYFLSWVCMSSLEITHPTLPTFPLLSSMSVLNYANTYKPTLPSVIRNIQQLVEIVSADFVTLASLKWGSQWGLRKDPWFEWFGGSRVTHWGAMVGCSRNKNTYNHLKSRDRNTYTEVTDAHMFPEWMSTWVSRGRGSGYTLSSGGEDTEKVGSRW